MQSSELSLMYKVEIYAYGIKMDDKLHGYSWSLAVTSVNPRIHLDRSTSTCSFSSIYVISNIICNIYHSRIVRCFHEALKGMNLFQCSYPQTPKKIGAKAKAHVILEMDFSFWWFKKYIRYMYLVFVFLSKLFSSQQKYFKQF